jgi:hypothetical protein
MKKFIVLGILLSLVGLSLFAQGNMEILEKTTLLDGTLEFVMNPIGKPTVYLVQEDGTKVEILLPEGAITQLQLRNMERVQIEGIFLGKSSQNQMQEKLFARIVVRNRERISINNPIQLSEQERLQLRIYQNEEQQHNKEMQNSYGETQNKGNDMGGGSGSNSGGSGGGK